MSNARSRGFTLVEALVAIAFMAFAIVGILQGLSSVAVTEVRAREVERMRRLAMEKYGELIATGEAQGASIEGDFEDRFDTTHVWEANTVASGIENLDVLVVTVTMKQATEKSPTASVEGLLFVAPTTGTGTGESTGGGATP